MSSDSDNTMNKEQKMKKISIVSTLLLVATLSSGAMAAGFTAGGHFR
jgi:hypothetical protein